MVRNSARRCSGSPRAVGPGQAAFSRWAHAALPFRGLLGHGLDLSPMSGGASSCPAHRLSS